MDACHPHRPASRRRAVAMALALALAACRQPGTPPEPPPAPVAAPATPAVDVVELGAVEASERMRAGTLTARELTQAYLDRIAAIDDAGPELNAVLELNPSALAEADALDAERKAGTTRGPLHGLPILVKDNVDVAGMPCTAGSLALADHRPASDAFVVARLRAAGAVILGKTNLSEWANFRSTRSTSGWSSLGGQTKNPHALDRNPCGSSSGTGSAVAASLAAVGVGTETDGSIICPSAVNGIVGLKPTVGLVSRAGIVPISITQDTAGPMGRSVADVALLLTAMAGVDPADPASGEVPATPVDYVGALGGASLEGARLGILRKSMGYHPDVDAATEAAISLLRAQGAEIVDATIAADGQWGDAEFDVLLYEFKDGLNRYLDSSGAPHPSLQALIEWNSQHAADVMPIFGQEIFTMAQAKGPLTDAAYREARAKARRLARDEGLLRTLDEGKLDALVAASTGPAWLTDPVLGDHFVGAGYGVAAVAGTPSITVPCGESHGLPLGLTFMGRPFSEARLLALAHAYEQASRARRPPAYRASAQ